MICDLAAHSQVYDAVSPRVGRALQWLRTTDFSKLEDGRHEIQGSEIYANISTKLTKPVSEEKPEAHRNYLDIQYIIDGTEYIGYCPMEQITELTEDHPDRDIAFYKGPMNYIKLTSDGFMLVYPQDVHAPGLALETPVTVRKAVVKIKL